MKFRLLSSLWGSHSLHPQDRAHVPQPCVQDCLVRLSLAHSSSSPTTLPSCPLCPRHYFVLCSTFLCPNWVLSVAQSSPSTSFLPPVPWLPPYPPGLCLHLTSSGRPSSPRVPGSRNHLLLCAPHSSYHSPSDTKCCQLHVHLPRSTRDRMLCGCRRCPSFT